MLTNEGYVLSKSNIPKNIYEKIKKELTVSPNNYIQKIIITYKVYTEINDKIIVPRYYGLNMFGDNFENKLVVNNCNIIFKGSLRDYQNTIVDLCFKSIKQNGGGLLSIGCGRGKTVIALKLASMLGVRTLVIVHKEFLQDQWIDRIKTFTSATTGIIRGNIIDIDNKDIVVGMINSISKRDYGDIFNNFSFVIYDEAHHIPAKVFSQALKKTGALYTFALSATPYRTDGLFKILNWYVGDIIYKENISTNKSVCVKVINFNSDELIESTIFINGKIKPNFVKMISDLIKIKSRITLICKIIKFLLKKNRKIILLSARIEHLHKLKKKVDKKLKKNNLDYKTYYYIGELSKKDRIEAEENCDILFCTYDMAHEALDIPRLNTAILATPKKDVVQSIGRIQRTELKCGNIRPLIIDICDNLSIFNKHGSKREMLYKKSSYTIEKYECTDGNFDDKLSHVLKLDNITDDMIVKN